MTETTNNPPDQTRVVLSLVCNALEKIPSPEQQARVLMAAAILLDLPLSMKGE